MDLLNTILNSMDAPPSTNEQQKQLIRKQKDLAERIRLKQKEELLRFRKYVEERMERFSKDDRPHIEFQPLDKVHRSIIHEVAEFGGFIAMSFGRDDVDRYSVVYKKENAPTEDEITARRNGDCWNEEVAKEYAERRKAAAALITQQQLEHTQSKHNQQTEHNNIKTQNSAAIVASNHNNDSSNNDSKSKAQKTHQPTTNYKDKYAHLIGQSAALQAARKTETNQSYGFVPSKNKKDMRSIEQTLADIQAKKKLKLQQQAQQQQQQHQQGAQQQQPPNTEGSIPPATSTTVVCRDGTSATST